MWCHITMVAKFLDHDDSVGNEQGQKSNRFTCIMYISKTATLHVRHAFLYIS